MKFNYVKIENMPVSIETDLKKLGILHVKETIAG